MMLVLSEFDFGLFGLAYQILYVCVTITLQNIRNPTAEVQWIRRVLRLLDR